MKIKLRRNKHNLSHYQLGTCYPGELVPVACVEVLPGDTFDHSAASLVRFLPMNAPIMHRVQSRIHHFFVPSRILWDGFEAFITRQSGAPSMPSLLLSDFDGEPDAFRLANYLGVSRFPTSDGPPISALRFAAYNFIYNEYYRDQDLGTLLEQDAAQIGISDMAVRRCSWQKDYFTAARPWPQKGADVTIPLGGEVPVEITEVDRTASGGATKELIQISAPALQTSGGLASGAATLYGTGDLDEATSVTIRGLRRALKLQALAERLAQFGSRYPEYLASMGVKSSDGRLQRPEYLGGGKVPLSFSEVLQTADGTTTQVGEMRGHGIGPGRSRKYRRFFEEHGFMISILSIRPQSIYSDVLPRDLFHGLVDGANDIYTPELERIGQQEIYNKEVWVSGDTDPVTGDDGVWGYNDRYAEYRHHPSRVTGDLAVGQNLDYWSWARGFESLPALNQTFTDCNPSSDIFFDTESPPIIFAVNHRLIAQRMLTKNVVGSVL